MRKRDEIANALSSILLNNAIKEEFGRNGKRMLNNYDWNEIAKQAERVYWDVTRIR